MLVIKVGGNSELNMKAICEDIAALAKQGRKVILVHGASHETNVISEKLGKPPRFVTSISGHQSRYTDRKTLEIFTMVAAGKVNKRLVEWLQQLGVDAFGLSGLDGRLLEGRRKPVLKIVENGKRKLLRGEWSGKIERVNMALLKMLLEGGYTPVVAPLAISYGGEAMNVDGDRAAAAIAAALKADTLVILSSVPGLLSDFPNEDSLIPRIPREEAKDYLERYSQGRMKKKLLGAIEALEQGVKRVILTDGRVEHPVLQALKCRGTVIE